MADTALHSMTENTSPAIGDEMYLLDNPTGAAADNRITLANLLKVINGLTTDSAPDGTADYLLTYDASASAAKKVLFGKTGYALQYFSASWDPADSTTYYFSNMPGTGVTTASGRRRIYVPRAGKITACYFAVIVSGTLGTTETATVSIRLNDTTDTTVSSAVDFDAAEQVFSKTDLAIAVAAGDWFNIKLACPAFATNPTTVSISGEVWIE